VDIVLNFQHILIANQSYITHLVCSVNATFGKAGFGKKVKYVFFETLVSPRIAQTVAEASGAETLVLDPLEGLSEAGRNNGDDYLKIMTRNIDNLELALGVK